MLDENGRGFCRPAGKGKFELQDGALIIEFRSSAADAAGTLHTMICTNSLGTPTAPARLACKRSPRRHPSFTQVRELLPR